MPLLGNHMFMIGDASSCFWCWINVNFLLQSLISCNVLQGNGQGICWTLKQSSTCSQFSLSRIQLGKKKLVNSVPFVGLQCRRSFALCDIIWPDLSVLLLQAFTYVSVINSLQWLNWWDHLYERPPYYSRWERVALG